MKSLVMILGQKKRVVLLGILMMLNIALFSLPGLPVNNAKVIQAAPEATIPDMQFIYSPDDVYDFLTLIGPDGRQAYQRMHLSTDLAFPIVYGFFLFSITSYLLLKNGIHHFFITWFALFAAGLDLAENFTLIFITDQYPEFLPGFVNLARIFTMGKFSFMFVSMLVIGYLSIKMIRRSNFQTNRKEKS